jgi:uncharacterized membrane protein
MKGIALIVALFGQMTPPLLRSLLSFVETKERAILLLIVAAFAVGLIKGRTMLAKAARKNISRLRLLRDPIQWRQLLTPQYCLLLLVMASMGIALRFLHLPKDIHAFIDLAVGFALVYSSFIYFRSPKEG